MNDYGWRHPVPPAPRLSALQRGTPPPYALPPSQLDVDGELACLHPLRPPITSVYSMPWIEYMAMRRGVLLARPLPTQPNTVLGTSLLLAAVHDVNSGSTSLPSEPRYELLALSTRTPQRRLSELGARAGVTSGWPRWARRRSTRGMPRRPAAWTSCSWSGRWPRTPVRCGLATLRPPRHRCPARCVPGAAGQRHRSSSS